MKLLITRHDKIGDFITALPLVKAIKTQYPTTHITLLVAPVNAQFAKTLPWVDHVIVYEKKGFWSLVRTLRREKFDASISCFITTRLGGLLWLSNIGVRVAPATKFAQVFFNRRITQRRSLVAMTEWQYNLELGMGLFPDFNPVFTPPLLTYNTPVSSEKKVVFHPGSGGSTDRNVRVEEYVHLARIASHVPNTRVFFTFGPDDVALKTQVEAQVDFPATLLPAFESLEAYCRFLSDCALFVSTSTGPMHLAGAVNIPTLSFFGSSAFASSKRWAPVNDPQKQHNFMLKPDYLLAPIETALKEALA
ncbi:glycosyltransferase family 9 protein [Sulfurospirillum sp. T05]|uniref:Glycosyltransferase family 9 protein n=1 Tax=Sulfurospirillum tamanense TaxID=2813362 RepID=A0ABS2WSK3_9BACT|nr:glycosyltransferase family 9 protein [Sulfurospirillum tamanensis]